MPAWRHSTRAVADRSREGRRLLHQASGSRFHVKPAAWPSSAPVRTAPWRCAAAQPLRGRIPFSPTRVKPTVVLDVEASGVTRLPEPGGTIRCARRRGIRRHRSPRPGWRPASCSTSRHRTSGIGHHPSRGPGGTSEREELLAPIALGWPVFVVTFPARHIRWPTCFDGRRPRDSSQRTGIPLRGGVRTGPACSALRSTRYR